MQNLQVESFLGTMRIGEAKGECNGAMTLELRISSTIFSMKFFWSNEYM